MPEVIRRSSGKPFGPNSGFYLSTAQHKQLVEALWSAVRKSFPLVVLTGPDGVGKSVLLQYLKATAPPDVVVAEISPERLGQGGQPPISTARPPAAAMAAATGSSSFDRLLDEHRRDGCHLLLALDDADEVSVSALDEIAGLLEHPSEGASGPTLLLVGSPKFEALLTRARSAALKRRRGVIFRFHPMTVEETSAYIRRQLQIAGLDPETFDETAIEAIHRAAFGLPKQVDALCSSAMAAMLREGRNSVDRAQVDAVLPQVHDTHYSNKRDKFRKIGGAPEAHDPEPESSSSRDLSSDSVGFLAIVEPSEFVFLSRDRPEGSVAEDRSRSGPIAGVELRNETPPSLQTSETRPPIREQPSQTGDQRLDPPKTATASVGNRSVLGNGHAATSRNGFRIHSTLRSVSAFLGGIAAVALVGLGIVTVLDGGRTDGYLRNVGDEPDASAEAPISGLGADSPAASSDAGDRRPTRSGFIGASDGEGPSSQIGLPSGGAAAPKLWQDAGGSLDTENRLFDAVEAPPQDRVGAEQFFRQGLEMATRDRRAAVLAFSRAAIRGHVRSAYYLGQIYETGDGVPADSSLARAWYALAGDHTRARKRAASLAAQAASREQSGERLTPIPPQPVFAERSPQGTLDLVWIGGRGTDGASGYIVELAGDPAGPAALTAFAEVSALRLQYPASDALWWRVTSMGQTSAPAWQRVPNAD